jgi:hypothetical protein
LASRCASELRTQGADPPPCTRLPQLVRS